MAGRVLVDQIQDHQRYFYVGLGGGLLLYLLTQIFRK